MTAARDQAVAVAWQPQQAQRCQPHRPNKSFDLGKICRLGEVFALNECYLRTT